MELTRVRSGGAEHATGVAAAGGDTGLMALLLGGNETTASGFPATLEAALADGDLAEEPIAASPAEGASEDGEAATVDLALAAALALGAGLADASAAEVPDAGGGTASGAGAAGDTASATTGLMDAAGASSGTPGGTLTVAPAPATATGPVSSDPASRPDASAEAAAVEAEAAETAAAAAAREKASGGQEQGASAAPAGGAGSATAFPDLRAADATAAAKHIGDATVAHGAGAGVEPAEATSFASGGAEHHGLDLGSSDRHGATLASEKPASHGTAPAGPAVALEAATPLRVEHADAGQGVTVTTTQVGTAPSASHDPAVAHAERTPSHPGGIEPRWGERVADAVRLSAVRGGGEIRLQLEPEGLGHIDVRLHVQGDGVRAVIVAEHEATRALLTSQQQVLHAALERSDLRLSGFSVDVGSGGGAASFASPDEQGRGGGAPAAPTPSNPAASASAEADAGSAPLATGRVNVRV